MVRPIASLLTVLILAAVAAGCGSDADTGTSPSDPIATVEVFSDATLNPNGARVHPFAVQAPGTVTATLTTLEPDATVLIGLGMGTWNGVACSITLANDSATRGTVLLGTASAAGNLCIRVFDNGRLTSTASYVVTLTHY